MGAKGRITSRARWFFPANAATRTPASPCCSGSSGGRAQPARKVPGPVKEREERVGLSGARGDTDPVGWGTGGAAKVPPLGFGRVGLSMCSSTWRFLTRLTDPVGLGLQFVDGLQDELEPALSTAVEQVDDPFYVLDRLGRPGVRSDVLEVLAHHERR